MMRLSLSFCFAALLLLLATPSRVLAQTAPAARALARELAESLGQRGAREFAEAGGEAAARATLEKAAQEGGESLAREIAAHAQRHGAQALRAFSEAPAAMAQAMRAVPAELSEAAMRAAAREPQIIGQLVARHGDDVLVAAAKHPGVGTDIAAKLGKEGAAVARNLSTPEAIRLARLGDDLARLPAADRAGLLSRIGRAPGRVLDYLEKHPIVFTSAAATAAYLGTAYLAIDRLLGSADAPGFLERMAGAFKTPVALILAAIAALIAARAFWWRRKLPRNARSGA